MKPMCTTIALVVALAVALLPLEPVVALSPSRSSAFTAATWERVPESILDDDDVALYGEPACGRASSDSVTARFEVDTTRIADVQSAIAGLTMIYADAGTASSSCDTASCVDIQSASSIEVSNQIVRVTVPFSTLVARSVERCDSTRDVEVLIRMSATATDPSDGEEEEVQADVALRLDLVPPEAPSDISAQITEAAVALTWTVPTGASDHRFYYAETSPASLEGVSFLPAGSGPSTELGVDLEGREQIWWALVARDEAGNLSSFEEQTASVVPVSDFWESYLEEEQGYSEGACQVIPVEHPKRRLPPVGLLWLVACTLVWRRRAIWSAALLATWLTLAEAQAQEEQESSRWGYISASAGAYYPQVDSAANGSFARHYGSGNTAMYEFELSYELGRSLWGALGVTMGLGWASLTGNYLTRSGSIAPGSTSFGVMPLRAGLLYQLPWLWSALGLPFVPYAGLGLVLASWEQEEADGSTSSSQGIEASGWQSGWQARLGVSLVLNVLDEGAAKALDRSFGINSSEVFVEYSRDQLDGLGQGGIDLSDTSWRVGLRFQF